VISRTPTRLGYPGGGLATNEVGARARGNKESQSTLRGEFFLTREMNLGCGRKFRGGGNQLFWCVSHCGINAGLNRREMQPKDGAREAGRLSLKQAAW